VIADLHCHYPMHLLGEEPSETYDKIRRVRGRPRWLDRLRALVFRIAARRFNYPDGWRVTFDGLEAARSGLVLSVLYMPFAEIDLDEAPQSDPEDGYFGDLIEHLEAAEAELRRIDPAQERHVLVRSAADLDGAGARMAFVHCVEGGFHLGRTEDAIATNVADLARRGVGYVTLAHLFYRGIATNAPALPMLSDRLYDRIFCQPKSGERAALTRLGEAAVRAMHEHSVLIDVSHMREDAFYETFDLLDRLDPAKELPVIASHAGYRFGDQAYMLDRPMVERIAERDGVIGLILAQHQLEDGLPDGDGIDHTLRTIRAHVDRIREITGSHAHVGIGSDLDGFIEPTMSGIETAEHLDRLVSPLREAYGEDADALLHGNAQRVVRRVLAGRGADHTP